MRSMMWDAKKFSLYSLGYEFNKLIISASWSGNSSINLLYKPLVWVTFRSDLFDPLGFLFLLLEPGKVLVAFLKFGTLALLFELYRNCWCSVAEWIAGLRVDLFCWLLFLLFVFDCPTGLTDKNSSILGPLKKKTKII